MVAQPTNNRTYTMQNLHKLKQDICDIGRRIYNRQFAAANDGNIGASQ